MLNKSTLKSNILAEFNNIYLNHNMSHLNKNDFHHFINGLYQAEGIAGAYFPKTKSLNVRFLFSLGQNYSPEALNVFLYIQKH